MPWPFRALSRWLDRRIDARIEARRKAQADRLIRMLWLPGEHAGHRRPTEEAADVRAVADLHVGVR